jgi:hypothetical protein
MRLRYLLQSVDTYDNVMPGFFSLDHFCSTQQLLSIGRSRIQVKLDLKYQKVSGFFSRLKTQHNQKLVQSIWYPKGF